MSDHDTDEIARLESEIAEREQRLEALTAPMSRDEAAELARTNPGEFNTRYEAARAAGRSYLKGEDR